MSETLRVAPDELRQNARAHGEFADELSTAHRSHSAVLGMLDSLGPVFADLGEAGRALLDQRRSCFQQQAAVHADLAGTLAHTAQVWEDHDGDAATLLGTPGQRL
jgi:hypothetical protein